MQGNLHLYTTYIKFITLLGKLNGLSVKEIRKILNKHFNKHPHTEDIIDFINSVDPVDDDIKDLFNECIRICDELGPSREYFTLLTLLEQITDDILENGNSEAEALSKDILVKFGQEIALINQRIPKPPLFNMLLETRSLIEWGSIYCIYPFIPKRIKGEGKPVLLIPPYLGDDFSTALVRRYLTSLGFKTYKWEQGINMIKTHYIPRLEEKLDDIYSAHGEKVSIVGWSGGGIFAKIMANRHPNQIEQIVTIGSPVWGVMDMKSPVGGILEFFRGKSLKERNKRFIEELEPIPNVPITCIYTKTDGVVPWKHCMEAESYRGDINNIEVYGSHSGLGANASVLMITADALSANIKGISIRDTISKIERFLYPYYWNRKMKSLFFLN